jgi:hypothetical protein
VSGGAGSHGKTCRRRLAGEKTCRSRLELANAVNQPRGCKLVKRVRQQAGSYGSDARHQAIKPAPAGLVPASTPAPAGVMAVGKPAPAGVMPASTPAPTGVMLCPFREVSDGSGLHRRTCRSRLAGERGVSVATLASDRSNSWASALLQSGEHPSRRETPAFSLRTPACPASCSTRRPRR